MTMRTYRYFACSDGHRGVEKTSENDQPYSTMWESVDLTGVRVLGADERGDATYVCETCGAEMHETAKPVVA